MHPIIWLVIIVRSMRVIAINMRQINIAAIIIRNTMTIRINIRVARIILLVNSMRTLLGIQDHSKIPISIIVRNFQMITIILNLNIHLVQWRIMKLISINMHLMPTSILLVLIINISLISLTNIVRVPIEEEEKKGSEEAL